MRRVTALITAVLLAGVVVVVTATPARACSCVPTSVEEALGQYAVLAFVGEPASVADVGYPDEHDDSKLQGAPLRWTFEVETVLKGDVTETIVIGTGYGDGDCGYGFENVSRIGVVAYADGDGLSTGICGGVWDADQLLAAHGPGWEPIAYAASPDATGDASQLSPLVYAGGVLLVLVVSVMVLRRRSNS